MVAVRRETLAGQRTQVCPTTEQFRLARRAEVITSPLRLRRYRVGLVSSEFAPPLGQRDRRRRSRHRRLWRIINPPTRPLAGLAPWWVLLETTGRRSGEPRTTPLARGPFDGNVVWLASVHGRHAAWVRNVEASPEVRLKLSARWYCARATVTSTTSQWRSALTRMRAADAVLRVFGTIAVYVNVHDWTPKTAEVNTSWL